MCEASTKKQAAEIAELQQTIRQFKAANGTLNMLAMKSASTRRVAEQACRILELQVADAATILHSIKRGTKRFNFWGKLTRQDHLQEMYTPAVHRINLSFSLRCHEACKGASVRDEPTSIGEANSFTETG